MEPLYTPDELDAVMSGKAATGAPAYVAPDLENPEHVDAVMSGEYKPPGQYKNPFTAPFEAIRDSYQVGESTVTRGARGTELMLKTDISDEQEMAERSALEKPHLDALSQKVDLFKNKLGPLNFWNFTTDAANILPSMVNTYGASLATGAVGAAGGAGLGFLAGNATGIGAVLPEEVVSVPTGAAWGFAATAPIGGVVAGAQMNMGNVYLDLRDKGVSRPNARLFAAASGVVMGGLEYFGMRQMTGVARKAFAKQLATPQGKAMVQGFVQQFQQSGAFGRILEGASTETATEVGQEITQLTAEALAQWADTGKEVWLDAKFWEDAQNRVTQTAITTARGSLLLAGGGEAGGRAAGKAVNSFKAAVTQAQQEEATVGTILLDKGFQAVTSGQMSLRQVFDGIKGAFSEEGQAAQEQTLEDISNMSDDEALQLINAPATQLSETLVDAIGGDPEAQQQLAQFIESPEGERILQGGITATEAPTDGAPVTGDAVLAGSPLGGLMPEGSAAPETDAMANAVDDTFGWETDTPGDVVDFKPAEGQAQFDFDTDENAAATGGLTPVETQARITQINTDIRALVAQEQKLDATLEKALEKGYKTDALLDRTEKILAKREELELEKELLNAGLMSREEVAERRGQARLSVLSNLVGRIQNSADRLNQTRRTYQNKLVQQKTAFDERLGRARTAAEVKASRQTKAAFQSGQFTEQKTIRSLQNQLIQVINAATTDAGFRSRLKTMVNKVTNRKQFNTAAKKIQTELTRLIKKKNEDQYQKARKKVIDQITKKLRSRVRTKGRGNPVVSSLDADTVKRLTTFRGYLQDQKAAEATIQEFLNDYGTQLAQRQIDAIPTADLEQFQIAQMAYEFDKQDLMSLNVAAGNVAQWLQDGRDAIVAKKERLKEQRQAERDMAFASVGVDVESVRKPKPLSKKKANAFRQFKGSTLMWNTLLDWVSPKDPNHQISKMMDITQSRDEYLAGKETSTLAFKTKLEGALKAAGSDKTLSQKMYEDSHAVVTFDYTTVQGDIVGVELDRAQVIEAALKLKDTSLHASMRDTDKGNGWTLQGDVATGQSFEEQVNSVLTGEDKAVIRAILEFYQDYHARFNAPYREKYGVDLPMRDNYSPVSRKGYATDPGNTLEFGSLLPGAAISRQNTLLRVELQNPYLTLENHIAQVERFIAYDNLVGTMRSVFGNSDMRETLKERYGNGTVEVIDNYVERFVQNRTTNWAQSDSLTSALMSDLSLSALTFKSVHQFLVQMTSTTAMYAEYSPAEIVKGMVAWVQNAEATEAALRSSPTLAHRFKSGASYEFSLATRKNSIGLNFISALLNKNAPSLPPAAYTLVSNLMYGAMRLGDAGGVARLGGAPVYHAELAKGATPEAALMRVNQLMEQTQQGDDPSQMPALYANSQYAYLFGGMFALQPLQLLGIVQTKINDFMNAPSQANAVKLGGQLAALWLIPGFTYGLIRNIPLWVNPPEDDDELGKDLFMDLLTSTLLGPANSAPLIGDVIERAWWAAAAMVTGTDAPPWTKSSRETPIGQLYTDPEAFIRQWAKMALKEDSDVVIEVGDDEKNEEQTKLLAKGIKAVSRWGGVSSALLNMPALVVQAISQGDYAAATMAIAGASPAKIKQRLAAGKSETDVIVEDDEDTVDFFGGAKAIEAQLAQEFGAEDDEDEPAFSESDMGDTLELASP